ncbi:hypothetical protein NMC0999 [Neisseria meningitidis FAM18]|uniref:Uncharacterized protein n=3 Tax=Neisseria meningitidis TaxID=487 RepID=A1KTS6_NEIMF|nr:hypothetical protein NMBB_1165 [Neisseria meningitidis alpha710]CAM08423.1 hypothetical protein NMA1227 [Neisseria meningitidis Z2491]CAM10266.1 hypothetical protein NMC0999 [Neisseria meningitidis FAM18]CBA05977.1 hypothetical protein predicted by Glimmer/Critica [Neisseria meningitidis alpha275]
MKRPCILKRIKNYPDIQVIGQVVQVLKDLN